MTKLVRRKMASLLLTLGVVFVLGYLAETRLPSYPVGMLTLVCINSILALSWNLVSGFTGQFSLGHAGFAAVGAYTSAILMMRLRLPFLVSFVSGGLMAGFFGFLVGFPSLRLVGDYLAIVTLGFQFLILAVLNNLSAITGGGLGLVGVPFRSSLVVSALTASVSMWVLSNLVHSKHGRCFVAVKEDEIAARSVGIDTTYYKISAFIISSFFAGLGGALIGHFTRFLHPDIFNYLKTIESVSMVILGGLGSLTGSILGATVITLLPELFRNLSTLLRGWSSAFPGLGLENVAGLLSRGWMVFYAALFLIIMLVKPTGIMGNRELAIRLPKWLAERGSSRGAS